MLFVLALAARVAAIFVIPPTYVVWPDSKVYLQIADNLVSGQGYVDDQGNRANRLPAYPLFLAIPRAVFGGAKPALLPIQLAQALLGALTCLILWRLAASIFGEKPGLVAGAILAVYPAHVMTGTALLIEPLLAFLLVLEVWLLKTGAEKGRAALVAAAGLAGGATIMLQATHALLFLFLLPLVGWAARRRRPVVLMLGFLGGMAFLPAVWTARNALVLDTFVPLSTRGSLALYGSFQPSAVGVRGVRQVPRPPEAGEMGEVEYARHLARLSGEIAREDLGRALRLSIEKQRRFWSFLPNYHRFRSWTAVAVTLPFAPVLLLFLVGMVRFPRTNPDAMWLLIPVVYFAAVHLVYIGSIRYRLPIEPFLIAIACAAAWDLRGGLRARRSARPEPG